MKRVGIALGGGGIAGSAHLGVLAALEEEGIRPHCLAGTSAGALVSALYASGYSISDIVRMIPEVTRKHLDYDFRSFIEKMFWRSRNHRSLIKGLKFRELLAAKLGDKRVEDLPIPVAFVATDLQVGKTVVFASRPLGTISGNAHIKAENISLVDAVQASCSIPFVFPPVEIGGRMLVDGGLLDNCPCEFARALGAEVVIGVDFSLDTFPESPLDSLLSVVTRSVNIMLLQQSKYLREHADIMLNPDVASIGALDFDKAQRCVEVGYEHTRRRMDAILAAIDGAERLPAFPDLAPMQTAFDEAAPECLMANGIVH